MRWRSVGIVPARRLGWLTLAPGSVEVGWDTPEAWSAFGRLQPSVENIFKGLEESVGDDPAKAATLIERIRAFRMGKSAARVSRVVGSRRMVKGAEPISSRGSPNGASAGVLGVPLSRTSRAARAAASDFPGRCFSAVAAPSSSGKKHNKHCASPSPSD